MDHLVRDPGAHRPEEEVAMSGRSANRKRKKKTHEKADRVRFRVAGGRLPSPYPKGSPTTRKATSVSLASFRISSASCSTRSRSASVSSFP